jgi:hypothetical protein
MSTTYIAVSNNNTGRVSIWIIDMYFVIDCYSKDWILHDMSLLYLAWMTVVGDTPDIDFRYLFLSLAYGIKMIECVVQQQCATIVMKSQRILLILNMTASLCQKCSSISTIQRAKTWRTRPHRSTSGINVEPLYNDFINSKRNVCAYRTRN